MLPLPGQDALRMGQHSSGGPSARAVQVKMRKPHAHRWAIRFPRHIHEARQSHTDQVRRLIHGVASILAKSRDRDHDQSRIDGSEFLITDPQSRHVSGPTGFDEKICRPDQAFKQHLPVCSGQVEGDAALIGRIGPPEQAALEVHVILIERADTPR